MTCSTPQSRNFSFGQALGAARASPRRAAGKLVEGALTAAALMQMARERAIEMPISATVEALVEGRIDAAHAVGALLARPLKGEDEA